MRAKIRFPQPYTHDRALAIESSIQQLLFDEQSPLLRCLKSEVTFDTFPFPTQDPLTGRIVIDGDFDDEIVNLLTYCSGYKTIKGIPVVDSTSMDLVPLFETAFLSYLSSFRVRRKKVLEAPVGRTFKTRISRAARIADRYVSLFDQEELQKIQKADELSDWEYPF